MILERTRVGRQMRLYRGSIHTFDVEPLVRALREEAAYLEHGRDGVTLVETPDLRVVLEVLMAGIGLDEHREPGPVTLHLLKGEMRFQAGEEVLYRREGEILAMPTNRPHSVEAVRDCAFLLTIGPSDEPGEKLRADHEREDTSDPDAMRRVVRRVRREWPAAQERFGGEWPAESGDEQC